MQSGFSFQELNITVSFLSAQVGNSLPSSPSSPFVAKDPWDKPGRPGAPTVSEVTKRSCVLTWTPPVSDGGCPIKTYVIEYKVSVTTRAVSAYSLKIEKEHLELPPGAAPASGLAQPECSLL